MGCWEDHTPLLFNAPVLEGNKNGQNFSLWSWGNSWKILTTKLFLQCNIFYKSQCNIFYKYKYFFFQLHSFFEGHNPSPILYFFFTAFLKSPHFLKIISTPILKIKPPCIKLSYKLPSPKHVFNGTLFFSLNWKVKQKQLLLDIIILICAKFYTLST